MANMADGRNMWNMFAVCWIRWWDIVRGSLSLSNFAEFQLTYVYKNDPDEECPLMFIIMSGFFLSILFLPAF